MAEKDKPVRRTRAGKKIVKSKEAETDFLEGDDIVFKESWFRIFVDKSYVVVISVVIGVLLIPYVWGLFSKNDLGSASQSYFSYFKARKVNVDDLAYSFGNYTFSRNELYSLYVRLLHMQYGEKGAEHYIAREDGFENFLKHSFESDLLAHEAMKENILSEKNFAFMFSYYMKERISELYLYKYLRSDLTDFENRVTKEEVLDFYLSNQEEYDNQGITEEVALEGIEETLNNLRKEESLNLIRDFRKKLVENIKNKEQVVAPFVK